jgi:hypothetical protein
MSVRLRPRNSWEALDLGIALVRQHARRVYGTWLVVYAPFAAILIAIFHQQPIFAWLVLWWLKPLFDRVVLEVLSGEIFDVHVPPGEMLRKLPGLLWRSGIIGALTWRRIDFARSMHLPVYQLERLTGRDARARIRVLDRDGRGAAVGMLMIMVFVEGFFALALSLAAALLTDIETPIGTLFEAWFQGVFSGGLASLYGVILAAIAMTAVEPIYAACGFTLYLQRRTALEGWDIELRFRQLAARVEAARRAAPALLSAALVAVAIALLAPAPAAGADDSHARQEIRKVLADPEFGHEEKRSSPVYVGPRWSPKPSEPSKPWNWDWLFRIQELFANGARAIAWTVAIFVALFALYHLARYARLRGFWSVKRERPQFLFGLDVRPESLPDDVAATAASLIGEGRVREALSLLYRGALVRFMDEGIEFLQGDTEGDCVRRVMNASGAARKSYFSRLVAAWQQIAYGHRAVARDAAMALARDWSSAFAPAPGLGGALRPAQGAAR